MNLPANRDASQANLLDHIFALLIGLTLFVLMARYVVLMCTPQLTSSFVLLAYQDVLALAILAWLLNIGLALLNGRRGQRYLLWVCLGLFLSIAAYTALYVIVYSHIRNGLTYRMIVTSDDTGRTLTSIATAFWEARHAIPVAILMVVVVGELLRWRCHGLVRRLRRGFYSRTGAAIVLVYFLSVHAWVAPLLRYRGAPSSNPEWTLLSSVFKEQGPVATKSIPREYFQDFQLAKESDPARAAGPLIVRSGISAQPRLNVILFVMESVNQRSLGLYGARYSDTPELIRLSKHALVFNRHYSSHPNSSSAMSSLFCSLFPSHDWMTIPGETPTVKVPGLATIFAQHGYRTAFIHSGALTYDHDGEFLISHGFGYVSGLPGSETAHDPELLPAALRWIKLDPSRPFFLTLWTHDTHSPYLAPSIDNYGVKNDSISRYLNGIRATDALIGQLARALDEMNLSDNTLLIITGDHGEAFGEHGQLLHGFSVYDEETHIPLMIVNPKLIPHEITVNRISRHVDLAPTLVDLLGYETPQQWQGWNLLADAPRRAYLFARNGDMSLGVVDGDYKYIENLTANRRELYDLKNDPRESYNLAWDPVLADMMAREHLRLAAWLAFQNRHIAQLGSFPPTH